MKEIKVLRSREVFECLAGDCPRSCCTEDWVIKIEQDVWNRWQSLPDTDEKDKLLACATFNDQENQYVLKKNEDQSCCALNSEGLCSIQLQYELDYMTSVCKSFPRIENKGYYREYITASLACPEIVESLLLTQDPMFKTLKVDLGSDTSGAVDKEHALNFVRLDDFIKILFEDTNYPIGLCLKFLSDVCMGLIAASDSISEMNVILDDVEANYEKYLKQAKVAVKKGELTSDPVTSGSFWQVVYSIFKASKIQQLFLTDDNSELGRAFQNADGSNSSLNRIDKEIKRLRKKSKNLLKNKFTSHFRKYVLISFVNSGFPIAPRHGKFDVALAKTMVMLSALQLLLWIELDKRNKLSNEFLMGCIVELNRKVYHNKIIEDQLDKEPGMLKLNQYCNCFIEMY